MAGKTNGKDRLKEITEGIEHGIQELFESERYMAYLRTMSRFHRYSTNNVMLIHMQRPNATLVAGFNKWKNQFGRHVKQGEKGLQIIAPTPLKKKIETQKLDPETRAPVLNEDGTVVMEEKEVRIPLYKVVTVFDVSQTEGKALPHLAENLAGDVRQYEIFMEALRRSAPVPMAFEPMEGMDGYFDRDSQRIAICEGMSQVQTVSAAVHEITHAKLHNYEAARLEAASGDETKKPPKQKDRHTEEVEAESVSYAVCQYYGIETGRNSFGYIATWSKEKSLPELRASLDLINKTASGLISDIDRHFAEICKERGIDLSAPEQATPELPEAEYVYKLHANPRSAGAADAAFIQVYERRDGQLYPGEVMGFGTYQDFVSLVNRLNAEQVKPGDARPLVEEATAAVSQPEPAVPREKDAVDLFDEGAVGHELRENPNATGDADRSLVITYTINGGEKSPSRVIYTGTTEDCQSIINGITFGMSLDELLAAFNQQKAPTPEPPAPEMEPEPAQTEALYLLDDTAYLHIQATDGGWDYTLFDRFTARETDGGRLDAPTLSLDAARDEILASHALTPETVKPVTTKILGLLKFQQEVRTASSDSQDVFSPIQQREITAGMEAGLDVAVYAKPELSWRQMEAVRTLMAQGHDPTAVYVGGKPVDFTDPALTFTEMQGLLRQMDYDSIPKMLYTPNQWAEIKKGMDKGLDVRQYADPANSAETMAKLRDALERGLIIRTAPDAGGPRQEQPQPGHEQWSEPATTENTPGTPGVPSNDVGAYLPELTLDEYPMPDPALTVDDLEKCGYLDGDMLPLSKGRALELYEQDLTIYTVAEGGEASMAFDREDIEAHGGLLAVPREEWEDSPPFADAVADRLNRQERREAAFLQFPRDAFAIYQLKDSDDLRDIRFEGLDWLESKGRKVERKNYDLVYTAPLTEPGKTGAVLDGLWYRFNNEHPADYHRPSLSVSDIVAIKQGGVVTCHYTDSFDFAEVPGFLPDNPLKNAEMELEDDYGMIDGIINNGPRQPTVSELEAQVKAGQQISLTDLAAAVHRERQKKSVVERLKQQPPQRDRKKDAPKKSAEREL